jgi:hypothetical protein
MKLLVSWWLLHETRVTVPPKQEGIEKATRENRLGKSTATNLYCDPLWLALPSSET